VTAGGDGDRVPQGGARLPEVGSTIIVHGIVEFCMSWFVVSLHYTAPLRAIDAAMKAHVDFLERQRQAGVFIVWGRKVPRTGGIILACGESRTAIVELMNDDPFVARQLAEVEVTEFLPKPSGIVDRVQRLLEAKNRKP